MVVVLLTSFMHKLQLALNTKDLTSAGKVFV